MSSNDGLPDLPGIDKADGLIRMMGKTALYEKVLREFHGRFFNASTLIRAALASGDVATAERQAHSTKGLAGMIGAVALHDAAMALEKGLHTNWMSSDSDMARFEQALRTVIDGIAVGFGIQSTD